MRKLILLISISLPLLSFTYSDSKPVPAPSVDEAVTLYREINLQEYGLSEEAFDQAWKGYHILLSQGKIDRPGLLTICDFSQSSSNKRFYLVDLDNRELLVNTYVAHGRNSGTHYATRFSNKPSSFQSSLGFYLTGNTYYGEHGLSLNLEGLEKGINDKARSRRIVIHGADYVSETWLRHSPYMGRSYGCPAIPKAESSKIINQIKNGSCMFIYHPGPTYRNGSKILND